MTNEETYKTTVRDRLIQKNILPCHLIYIFYMIFFIITLKSENSPE